MCDAESQGPRIVAEPNERLVAMLRSRVLCLLLLCCFLLCKHCFAPSAALVSILLNAHGIVIETGLNAVCHIVASIALACISSVCAR
jgi:hypothetical protein